MELLPLAASEDESSRPSVSSGKDDTQQWMRVTAAGTLAASGVLLMAGKRRAGLVTAAAGTALVVIDQQDTVCAWWNRLPEYLAEAQSVLTSLQSTVDELSAQGDRLRTAFERK